MAAPRSCAGGGTRRPSWFRTIWRCVLLLLGCPGLSDLRLAAADVGLARDLPSEVEGRGFPAELKRLARGVTEVARGQRLACGVDEATRYYKTMFEDTSTDNTGHDDDRHRPKSRPWDLWERDSVCFNADMVLQGRAAIPTGRMCGRNGLEGEVWRAAALVGARAVGGQGARFAHGRIPVAGMLQWSTPLVASAVPQGDNLAALDDATTSELVAPKWADRSAVCMPISPLGGIALATGQNTGVGRNVWRLAGHVVG